MMKLNGHLEAARAHARTVPDPVHCSLLVVICVSLATPALLLIGLVISMLGLAAVPVGDIQFTKQASDHTFSVVFPTKSSHFPRSKTALVNFEVGVAASELGFNETTGHYDVDQPLGTALAALRAGDPNWAPYPSSHYRPYTPGLRIKLLGDYYMPTYEWKVVPEEMPLLWIAPLWCFFTGTLVYMASVRQNRDLLLNGLLFVGIAASLVLVACHRVVELTYLCRTCNGMTSDEDALKHGKLGLLVDGVFDPDDFADNNCPSALQAKCEKGTGVYLAGSVILLVCMYVLFITVEFRRSRINAPLAELDQMAKN